jgi:hypothetical protein
MSNVQHSCSVTSFAEIAINLMSQEQRPKGCKFTYDNGYKIQPKMYISFVWQNMSTSYQNYLTLLNFSKTALTTSVV